MSEAKEEKESKKSNNKKVIVVLAILLIVVALIPAIYFGSKYQKNQSLLKNPDKAKTDEAQSLVVAVGKLVKLPAETPAIATVSDISKLQGQTLFRNAQNGDKVLIFAQAKKAVVYRPSTNQVIDIGNIVVSPSGGAKQQANVSTSVTPSSEKVNVAIYNATKTPGYAKTVGASLASKFSDIELGTTGNASGDYQKIIVVDLSGSNKALAASLAKQLGGEVGSMPAGETKPADAQILVILGK